MTLQSLNDFINIEIFDQYPDILNTEVPQEIPEDIISYIKAYGLSFSFNYKDIFNHLYPNGLYNDRVNTHRTVSNNFSDVQSLNTNYMNKFNLLLESTPRISVVGYL